MISRDMVIDFIIDEGNLKTDSNFYKLYLQVLNTNIVSPFYNSIYFDLISGAASRCLFSVDLICGVGWCHRCDSADDFAVKSAQINNFSTHASNFRH